jgi:photosystem II stability/assembly factor-like uncharacterized protein
MKIYNFVFLFFISNPLFLIPNFLFGSWERIDAGINEDITSVYFIDTSTGYAVGNNGLILKLGIRDKELGIRKMESRVSSHLMDVYFVNNNIGYAVGLNGTILKTSDGGETWINISDKVSGIGYKKDSTYLLSVYFIDEKHGFIVGGNVSQGAILLKTDDGENFAVVSNQVLGVGEGIFLTRIKFVNSNTGYIVGSNGTILELWISEQGLGIRKKTSGVNVILNDIGFSGSSVYIVGEAGTILSSQLPGDIWVKETSGTKSGLTAIDFYNGKGYIVGDNGVVLSSQLTVDSRWRKEKSNIEQFIYDIDMKGKIAVGEKGLIIRYVDSSPMIVDGKIINEQIVAPVQIVNENSHSGTTLGNISNDNGVTSLTLTLQSAGSDSLSTVNNGLLTNNKCKAKARILTPSDGKKINGNAITVLAELVSGKEEIVSSIEIQYKIISSEQKVVNSYSLPTTNCSLPTEWQSVGIVKRMPYMVTWDASKFANGEYSLIAVAVDKNGIKDQEHEGIRVYISEDADIVEEIKPNGNYRKVVKINGEEQEILLHDGTRVIVPKGLGIRIEVEEMSMNEVVEHLPVEESALKPIGIFRRINIVGSKQLVESGNSLTTTNYPLPTNLTIEMPYKDENDDGILDGTNFKIKDLKLCYLDSKGKWRESKPSVNCQLSTINKALGKIKVISGKVEEYGIYGIFAKVPAVNLDNVIVYPNPYKPNSGLGHTGITFDGLMSNVKIRIYTISGRLVRTIDVITDGKYEWKEEEMNDDEGRKLPSGVYIYIITSGDKISKGKIAIIR